MSAAEHRSWVETYSTISFFSRASRASFCVPFPFILLIIYIVLSVYQPSMGGPWGPTIHTISNTSFHFIEEPRRNIPSWN